MFPADAGVFPSTSGSGGDIPGISRRGGGDPDTDSPAPDDPECFPQARG